MDVHVLKFMQSFVLVVLPMVIGLVCMGLGSMHFTLSRQSGYRNFPHGCPCAKIYAVICPCGPHYGCQFGDLHQLPSKVMKV